MTELLKKNKTPKTNPKPHGDSSKRKYWFNAVIMHKAWSDKIVQLFLSPKQITGILSHYTSEGKILNPTMLMLLT